MTTGLSCPLCSRRVTGANVECNSVHAAVLNSWVWDSEADYAAYYRSPDYHDVQYRVNRGKSCQELYQEARQAAVCRLGFLNLFKISDKPSLIDVGAGNGALVDEARWQGYRAEGIDPHPIGTVKAGTWQDVDGEFDFICLHDVLEHMVNPRACLTYLRAHLNETGLLIVEMPEYQARGWEKHRKPKEHLTLYSREAAEQLYRECGLEPILFYRPLRAEIGKQVHFLQRAR